MIGPELLFRRVVVKGGVLRKQYIAFCRTCGKERYVQLSRIKDVQECKGCATNRPIPQETRAKISETLRWKYKNDGAFKERVSAAQNPAFGDKHWNWKGGITPLTQRTRTGTESNAWTLAVLYRDSFKCRLCGEKENLHAHHLNGWAEFPEERYILENGMTLCSSCHKFYHHYEREARNNGNFGGQRKE